uniref:SNARE-complex protein Syntaxin-18 N-terminal domain-containing protein n=1 Tax=Megaselia scalaris TaxID=36166 RepID=T1GZE5_MEGSC
MDITAVFKASVMAVKLRNKQVAAMGGATTANGHEKISTEKRISPRHRSDPNALQAKDICHKITELKNFFSTIEQPT